MPTDLPIWIPVTWLLATVLAQSAVDTPLSRDRLPSMSGKARSRAWLAVNGGTVVLLVLVFRLLLFPQERWLFAARDGGWMAYAVLLLSAEYFVWGALYAVLRGRTMLMWKGRELSTERRHEFWGYVWSSSLVGFVLMGFLYVTVQIVIPLMAGVEDRFGGV